MDIFEFAMKMELDGKAYYENGAKKTKDPNLRQILTTLADEEQRHYQYFKRMKDGETKHVAAEVNANSGTLSGVQNIFTKMSKSADDKAFGDDEISLWMGAMKIEEDAVKFYSEKAAAETNPEKKEILELIADEERNHVNMIDGVLMYLKDPSSFADSAQFKNFMSLEGH